MKVVFLVPGLLNAAEVSDCPSSLPSQLGRWLASCRVISTVKTISEWWLNAFGISPPCGSAPWLALDDGYFFDDKWWTNISFGHLHVTLNSTTWIPAHLLGVTAEQLTELSQQVCAHWFSEETWHVGKSGRSYVSSTIGAFYGLPDPTCFINNELYGYADREGNELRRLQNELGMLLHSLPTSLRSNMHSSYIINSAYFYGTGLFSKQIGSVAPRLNCHVYSNHPLALVLANHSKCIVHPSSDTLLQDMLLSLTPPGSLIIIQLDTLLTPSFTGDMSAWIAARNEMDDTWFSPVQALYDKGIITELEVLACECGTEQNQMYKIIPSRFNKFKIALSFLRKMLG